MESLSFPSKTTPVQLARAALTRVQLGVVLIGYAGVLVASAGLLFLRHLQYVRYASAADASGGMWAFGDFMLELFIAGLFLIPTLLLAFFLRKSEPAFTRYSQTLIGVACTAPLCIAAFFVPAISQSGSGFLGMLGWFCLGRVSASPVVVVGLVCSRLLAPFKRAKRLIMYAVLIEMGTLVLMLGTVLVPWHKA